MEFVHLWFLNLVDDCVVVFCCFSFSRWLRSPSALLYDPALGKTLRNLMVKLFMQVNKKIEDSHWSAVAFAATNYHTIGWTLPLTIVVPLSLALLLPLALSLLLFLVLPLSLPLALPTSLALPLVSLAHVTSDIDAFDGLGPTLLALWDCIFWGTTMIGICCYPGHLFTLTRQWSASTVSFSVMLLRSCHVTKRWLSSWQDMFFFEFACIITEWFLHHVIFIRFFFLTAVDSRIQASRIGDCLR